jgi:hypothetical protein
VPARVTPGMALDEIRRVTREAQDDPEILANVAMPMVVEAAASVARGDRDRANAILVHAVHDGIDAVMLMEAIAATTAF